MDIKKILEAGIDMAKVFPKGEIKIAFGEVGLKKNPQGHKPWLKFDREKLYKFGWPQNQGTYQVKDPASSVAVICPAQNSELQAAALDYGAAISGCCITPDRGVELVITNTTSNPNIRWIILAGKDSGHLAGDVIYCVNKYGRDPLTERVLKTKCPTNPYLLNISEEVIERFQKQVKVINLLGGYDAKDLEQVKSELGLVIRCCVQEPKNAIRFTHYKLGDEIDLFDPGAEGLEPFIVDLKVEKIGAYYEGYHRVGTAIHINTVAEAYPVLMSHIVNKGSWGKQESTRMVLDTLATQAIIHNTKEGLVPPDWRPFGWMKSEKDVLDYLEKYRVWVYLFPLSDVRYDEKEKTCVPYIPEHMEYVYGGRLTAYWYELSGKREKESIRNLVKKVHRKFRYQLPSFEDVLEFYGKLAKIQKTSFNQIYKIAKAAKVCVDNGFGNSYRLYMSLQTPPIDIKEDPRQAHNPCFTQYAVYPRRIDGKWQLDAVFYMRAHDILAFPANANGGIELQKFIARFAGIEPGLYVHHAGSIEVCDYMLPKEILEKHKDKE